MLLCFVLSTFFFCYISCNHHYDWKSDEGEEREDNKEKADRGKWCWEIGGIGLLRRGKKARAGWEVFFFYLLVLRELLLHCLCISGAFFFFCLCDINTQRQRLPSWHLPYAPYCFSPFVNCALFLRFLQPFFFVCVFPFCSRSWCFGMLVVCAFYGITFFFFLF